MAKLNGVVLTATTIEYNGVKYEMVFVTPKAGDILRVDESDYSYVTEGAYYEVDHVDNSDDPQIIDNDGDVFDGAKIEYTLFRKVTEPQSAPQQYREVRRPAEVGERIRIVKAICAGSYYKDGDELLVRSVMRGIVGKNDHIKVYGFNRSILDREYVVLEPIAEQPDDIIVVDGVKYRKVDRAPKVGDFVYATESVNNLTKGKLYPVYDVDGGGDGVFCRDDGHRGYYPNNRRGRLLVERIPNTAEDLERQVSELQTKLSEAEAELAAKKAEEEKAKDPRNAFAVGDEVRLISGGDEFPLNGYKNGEVYTVSDPLYSYSNKIEITGGQIRTGYALPEQLKKLTEEEIAEMDRLKVGEYAKVLNGLPGYTANGDIVKIAKDDRSSCPYMIEHLDGKYAGWSYKTDLIRATDEEVAEAKRKLELSKFTEGTHVKLTVEEGKLPKHGWGGVKNGEVGVVSSVKGSVVKVDFPGHSRWNADPSELTILTTEEAEEVAKWAEIGREVGEFKEGDLIEITRYQGGDKVGTIAPVTSVYSDAVYYKARTSGVLEFRGDKDAIKLVAPVESVVNLTTA